MSLTILAHELLAKYTIELDTFAADSLAEDDIVAFMNWIDARRHQKTLAKQIGP